MSLIIEPRRLRAKPERIRGRAPAETLEIETGGLARPEGSLAYDLTAQLLSGELIVRGALEIGFACRCARCGDSFSRKVLITDFYRNFALTSKSELINLTADVREDILLALPMVAVCSETCRGLCRVCGANLNRESCKCKPAAEPDVWQKLGDLRLPRKKRDS
ncbi:MAG: DUF177 domain-containing protein [Kiritimatiellae bacterium]|jgi:hypothetical protein|nr:DUF177 domain-containing protein [Kiritimatiellia bacterium]